MKHLAQGCTVIRWLEIKDKRVAQLCRRPEEGTAEQRQKSLLGDPENSSNKTPSFSGSLLEAH